MHSRFYSSPLKTTTTQYPPQQLVYPQDIQCVYQSQNSNSTSGSIYIGNLQAAQNLNTLRKYNIKAVLTACSGIFLNHPKQDIPYFKYIPGQDHQQFDLSKYFQECIQFIDDALNKTNILVHCMAGISRSVTLVLAFLIKIKGHTYDSSYNLVKSRRKIIHPNSGFISQLKRYERSLGVSRSNERVARYDSPARISHTRSVYYDSPQKQEYNNKNRIEKQSSITANFYKERDSSIKLAEQNRQQKQINPYFSNYKNQNSYSELKSSQYTRSNTFTSNYTGKANYQNQEQLDRKIAQIRKKYQTNINQKYGTNDHNKSRLRHAYSYYQTNQNKKQIPLKKQISMFQTGSKTNSRFYDSPLIPSNFNLESRQKLKKMNTLNDYNNNSRYFAKNNLNY